MLALSFSLQWMEQNRIKRGVICSDSLSALTSAKSMSTNSRYHGGMVTSAGEGEEFSNSGKSREM